MLLLVLAIACGVAADGASSRLRVHDITGLFPMVQSSIQSFFSNPHGKRTLEFDDPRMFSSAFGKRSSDNSIPARDIRSSIDDPRFMSMAFGKRNAFDDSRFMSASFGKRSSEFLDPRLMTSSFGKRNSFDDPRLFSSSFGKRSSGDFDDPRFASLAFGRRRR